MLPWLCIMFTGMFTGLLWCSMDPTLRGIWDPPFFCQEPVLGSGTAGTVCDSGSWGPPCTTVEGQAWAGAGTEASVLKLGCGERLAARVGIRVPGHRRRQAL